MYRHHKKTINSPEEGYIPPFKIADGLYFVGTHQASSHLIDTGEGLILIDTGYANTAEMVLSSVSALGFEPSAIKYIINTHWHGDHVAGSGIISQKTGAKNIIHEKDAPYVIERGYFHPDLLVKGGDTLALGDKVILFVHTPGHTLGTLSLFFDTTYEGKTYRVGTFGGAGANTLVPTCQTYYEGCREDYAKSLERLLLEDVDIFIGNHVWNNDTEEKGKRLLAGEKNDFIDATEWKKFLLSRRDILLSLPPLDTY